MNKLCIYYSNTGNGEIVANKYQEAGYELYRLVPKKDLPKKFFFKVMTGGFLAGMGIKAKLVDFYLDINSYDKIVIVSPIWNGRTCSCVNTLLKKIDFKNKDLTFVFNSGSGEGEKAKKRINNLYPNSKLIFLKEPKKYPDELDKLKEE